MLIKILSILIAQNSDKKESGMNKLLPIFGIYSILSIIVSASITVFIIFKAVTTFPEVAELLGIIATIVIIAIIVLLMIIKTKKKQ